MDSVPEVLNRIDRWVYEETGESLSDLQRILIQESWEGRRKTYEQIAVEYNYSTGYIQQVVGPKLWRLLSKTSGQKVTKTNVKAVLVRGLQGRDALNGVITSDPVVPLQLESPGESVPLDSKLYVQRAPYEPQCYHEILQPGALLRIKAPRQMGKTSLMQRLLAQAQQANCKTVCLNFKQVERDRFNNLDQLLRWCCANLARQLHLPIELERYWDEDVGSKMSCTLYLEAHLLEPLETPLILAIEEVGELLENLPVAQEFLTMLRAWHESGKCDSTWQKLHIIMVQSTEMYVPLNINQSPFNVGFAINLQPFNHEQIVDLTQRHQLNLAAPQLAHLEQLLGGHPYLIRLMLFQVALMNDDNHALSLASLMATASTNEGIYREYLQRHLRTLQMYPELADAFRLVLGSSDPVDVEQKPCFQLQSMGLVQLTRNQAEVSCQLYQRYFSEHL